jgi:hypothetical protein
VLAKAVEDAKRLGRQELSLVAAVHLADLGIHTSTEASLEETMGTGPARLLLTRHGQISEGEALAREAVERATATEYFSLIAESYLALAEVLRLSERAGEASEALEHALRVYEGRASRRPRTRFELVSPSFTQPRPRSTSRFSSGDMHVGSNPRCRRQ